MNSVGTRLFAAFLAIIVLVILMISFTLIVLLRNSPLVQRQDLAKLVEISATITRVDLPGADLTPAQGEAKVQQLAQAYGARVLLTNSIGDVLLDSARPNGAALNLRRFHTARQDTLFPQVTVGQVRDSALQQWLFVARPFGADRMLVTAAPPRRLAALLFFGENLLLPMAEAAVVVILVAVILAILIARSIAQPLGKMATVAQGIAQGDYTLGAPESGPDEVRALGQALNSMKQQVQANQQGQRDFLANVSHELKTPLTSIQGFAQAMLDGAAATPDAIQRSAGIIFSEADRMRRLVEGLLDLARLDAGLRMLNRTSLDLRAMLAAVAEKFSLRAQEKGVELRLELPSTLPAMAGDADRLAQVFNNLLDNAVKHTPTGGKVTVAATATPGWVEASVGDTGPGIPAEDLSRIFERFYQVDKSRARRAGVGLGLTISKEIVEAHGGSLRAESVVGLGSRFVVRLPLVSPDDPTMGKKRSEVRSKIN
jgi:signal transduction histidine kinase